MATEPPRAAKSALLFLTTSEYSPSVNLVLAALTRISTTSLLKAAPLLLNSRNASTPPSTYSTNVPMPFAPRPNADVNPPPAFSKFLVKLLVKSLTFTPPTNNFPPTSKNVLPRPPANALVSSNAFLTVAPTAVIASPIPPVPPVPPDPPDPLAAADPPDPLDPPP